MERYDHVHFYLFEIPLIPSDLCFHCRFGRLIAKEVGHSVTSGPGPVHQCLEILNKGIDVRGKVYMTGVELPWSDDLANKTSDIYKGLEEHLCYTEQVSFYVNITLLNAWSACKLTDVYKGSVIATTRVWFDLGRLEESQVQTDSSRFLDSLKMLLEAYKKHIDPNVAYYGEVIYVREISLFKRRKADLREDVLLTCLISSIHRYKGSLSLRNLRDPRVQHLEVPHNRTSYCEASYSVRQSFVIPLVGGVWTPTMVTRCTDDQFRGTNVETKLPCDLEETRGLRYCQIAQVWTGVVEIEPSGLLARARTTKLSHSSTVKWIANNHTGEYVGNHIVRAFTCSNLRGHPHLAFVCVLVLAGSRCVLDLRNSTPGRRRHRRHLPAHQYLPFIDHYGYGELVLCSSSLVKVLTLLFNPDKSNAADEYGMSSLAVHIQWPCRGLNPGHLTCEASVLPLLHQRTLDASEFLRLNRRTCSHLSDVIGVPDLSNDDPVTVLVVAIGRPTSQDVKIRMPPTCVGGVVVTRSPRMSGVRGSNPGTVTGCALLMSSNKSETRVQCFRLAWTHQNNYARTEERPLKREWGEYEQNTYPVKPQLKLFKFVRRSEEYKSGLMLN
ncbi:hypothetical protein CLF_108947 [Clonorchis sinensis]|uniref:Uncharacterized protein n=1 Tax=Clonorchis sinensis TaxID=79923 RepID=G7YS36_CLOSI|nr:hypothetical protein CLF_108947 [Clonorchis sinensis]